MKNSDVNWCICTYNKFNIKEQDENVIQSYMDARTILNNTAAPLNGLTIQPLTPAALPLSFIAGLLSVVNMMILTELLFNSLLIFSTIWAYLHHLPLVLHQNSIYSGNYS